MKIKKIFLFALLLAGYNNLFAQSYCTIKKAHAWFNAAMPGAQMVDENGNPINPKPIITRFIYVEYNGTKAPEIKSVTYDGTALSFTVVKLAQKTVWAGEKELNAKNIMTARKGNSFIKIELQPLEGKTMPDAGCKSMVITSKVAGKPCKFYISNEKQFATLPRY